MVYLPKASVRRLLRLGAAGDQLGARLGDPERRSGLDDLSERWKLRKPYAGLRIQIEHRATVKPVSGATVYDGERIILVDRTLSSVSVCKEPVRIPLA